ncbi:MAG: hypothetical protein J0I77_14830 [Rudaea sp.]|uniref:hypothetical protein n=1 Tax=unclassified Rudaea TaxID=2627037 RepID=UPI0010F80D17|nr:MULTISPECIES: hypothetical protein [unclassified Rudaea]MBN8886994.1 hypothetical protein [Rudaea sp.]
MLQIDLIVLARAIHVIAGVAWAGATFMLASVIVPIALRHGAEGAGRWMGLAARRAGMSSMIAALLTVLSGIYLFAVLHAQDASAGGFVLKTGAAAALLSIAVGIAIARPAGMQLGRLQQALADAAPPPADTLQRIAVLRRRQLIGVRAAAGLLGLAVIAMAVFRYASALA